MADGTVFQFEAALGINCAKVCTVISAFSFCFFYIFKLYNASFFCLLKHRKKIRLELSWYSFYE